LRNADREIMPIDIDPDGTQGTVACDLRSEQSVSALFRTHSIQTVIHLAGILPSAFQADPLAGAAVNLNASIELIRQAAAARVKRFVFASSMSVYGSRGTSQPLTETEPVVPDEPYGGSKRVIELIGGALATKSTIEFVALRIARVVGPGIRKSLSLWHSQIFETALRQTSIVIPFSPQARLSLVHVNDVARMLMMLADIGEIRSSIYNTPAEIWTAQRLKGLIEEIRRFRVELVEGAPDGGPMCEGSRFVREFGFQSRGLRAQLSDCAARD